MRLASLGAELENGKLASTIKTFCRRASAESSEKYCWQLVVLNNPNSKFNNMNSIKLKHSNTQNQNLDNENELEGESFGEDFNGEDKRGEGGETGGGGAGDEEEILIPIPTSTRRMR